MRTDAGAVRLGATPIEVRPGGYKVYRGVATYGDVVLEYPEDGWNEFVPASTALDPETVRLTEGVPLTLLHPGELLDAEDEEAIKEHTEGMVLRALADMKANPPEMVVDVIVYTASAQQAIESGRIRDLSLGYDRQAEDRAGEHLGKRYQKVQTRRRPNHLSAVHTARSTTPDGRRARLDSSAASAASRPVAGDQSNTIVLPPSRRAVARMDGLATAPAGHPALCSLIHPYSSWGVLTWRGWSEPADRSWVAFWPRDVSAPGLLFTRRSPTGAVLGSAVTLPARPYAHGEATMEDDLTIEPSTTTDRSDADVTVEAEVPTDDPVAAALAVFSPEAVEILKTLPEEDMAVLKKLVLGAQGEAAEEAVIAAGSGGLPPVQVEEVDDATVPAAAQALTMDAVQKMIADAMAKAGMAPKADAISTTTTSPAATARPVASPAPVPRIDAADVARRAADLADADRQFVERVRSAGHRCDSVRDATSQALAVIKQQSPGLVASAERALRDGRRDDFAAMFDAAEDSRRADLLGDQFGVLDVAQRTIAADRLGQPAAFPSNVTAPARAVTGD